MINPQAYRDHQDEIEAAMVRARRLGLWRTAARLAEALREARGEELEASPKNVPEVAFIIGPVREQP